jgi:hypothetical protein
MINNRLIFIPALSVGALASAMKNDLKFADNTSMRYYHADFISALRYPYFLITGGHYFKNKTICKQMGLFDSNDVLVFGDSGGYQIATGALKYTDDLKIEIFNWLENNSTIAANLDIPPFGTYTFKESLRISLLNFDYFDKNQTGRTKYLNVLQGKNLIELTTWYNEVKDFNFSGWAINVKGNSFEKIMSSISLLMENKEFSSEKTFVHFFGTTKIDDVIIISELQRIFNLKGYNVHFTIDSSSPNSSRFGSYYYGYNLKNTIFNTLHYPKLDTMDYEMHEFGDINSLFIKNPANRFDKFIDNFYTQDNFHNWDTVINSVVTLHNMYEIIELVDNINNISNYPLYIKRQLYSSDVMSMIRVLNTVLNSNSVLTEFKNHYNTIVKLSRNAPVSALEYNDIF